MPDLHVNIRKAAANDAKSITHLGLLLFEGNTFETLHEEFIELLTDRESAVFIAESGASLVAFAQCQLRHDYVEGTNTSPVGYLEGIYVCEGFRRKGIARALLSRCENWAREMGCTEFASDCEQTNIQSTIFHEAVGFTEANRIICFTKAL